MHRRPVHIRTAEPKDVTKLLQLEQVAFQGDRMNRRQVRYLVTRARAVCLLAEFDPDEIAGYIIVLFSRAAAHARVYSIAVAAPYRGQGLGSRLLREAEKAARSANCISMRLEARHDNEAALSLYRARGYRPFETVQDYYEDHEPAVRLEKSLTPIGHRPSRRIPYYRQSLDFTCGPAALMMAMKALHPELKLNRGLELDLWREATSIFMTSGIGGCTPFGLGLAAHNRGFAVELYTTAGRDFLIDSVRSPIKKEVIQEVQAGFIRKLKERSVPMHNRFPGLTHISKSLDQGAIPVVLISSYRIYGEKSPHWVVVTDHDERFVYVHDPFVDSEEGETVSDSLDMPILHQEFNRMSRYGRAGVQAVCLVSRRG